MKLSTDKSADRGGTGLEPSTAPDPSNGSLSSFRESVPDEADGMQMPHEGQGGGGGGGEGGGGGSGGSVAEADGDAEGVVAEFDFDSIMKYFDDCAWDLEFSDGITRWFRKVSV